jgi:pimeloyl-ACP methyl ester carboxylesterase
VGSADPGLLAALSDDPAKHAGTWGVRPFAQDRQLPRADGGFIRFQNFTSALPQITAPALIMGGDRLKFEAKGSRTIYAGIPDARLAIFAGGMDPLSTERQEIHDDMILDFLADRPIKSYPGVTYMQKG